MYMYLQLHVYPARYRMLDTSGDVVVLSTQRTHDAVIMILHRVTNISSNRLFLP